MTAESGKGAGSRDTGTRKGGNRPTFFSVAIVIVIILTLCIGVFLVINSGNPAPAPGGDEVPVPGHPDLFGKRIDAYYENLTQITVIESRNATDPSFGRLMSFLGDDATEQGVYGPGHECSSFAVELHDHAERCYIKAHLVLVSLSNASLHMIVGFNTTGMGMVYIDDTGLTQDEISRDLLVADRTVNLTVGSPYIRHFVAPFDSDENPGMGTVESFAIVS
jgi:hypothetical protein